MYLGTVFQTVLSLLYIIPRLRPGLLSLRSVLSSRQLSFCARSPSALSPCSKSITDNPDATDLFFHGFLLCLAGFLCACRALGLSRINSCWRSSSAVKAQIQSVVNPIPSSNTKLNPWKEQIRRIRFIREPFERVRTEPKAKEHNNVVLSSRLTKGNM